MANNNNFVSFGGYFNSPKDDGKNGKHFEIFIKEIFGLKKVIAKIWQYDLTKKARDEKLKFECKTGGGALFEIDENGEPINDKFFRNDFVIYCAYPNELEYVDGVFSSGAMGKIFVCDTQVFYELAVENKALRLKKSTARYKAVKEYNQAIERGEKPKKVERLYNDIVALRDNKTYRERMTNAMIENAFTLDEFISDYELKTIFNK